MRPFSPSAAGLVHLQNVITAEDSALGVETFLEPVLIIHRGALCLNLDARVTERGKGLAERGFRAGKTHIGRGLEDGFADQRPRHLIAERAFSDIPHAAFGCPQRSPLRGAQSISDWC